MPSPDTVPQTHLEDVRRRAERLSGQVRAIPRMLAEGAACASILQQVAAAEGALRAIRGAILRHRLRACIEAAFHEAGRPQQESAISELLALLESARG